MSGTRKKERIIESLPHFKTHLEQLVAAEVSEDAEEGDLEVALIHKDDVSLVGYVGSDPADHLALRMVLELLVAAIGSGTAGQMLFLAKLGADGLFTTEELERVAQKTLMENDAVQNRTN